jgi:hypothetical protein
MKGEQQVLDAIYYAYFPSNASVFMMGQTSTII